VDPTLPIHPKLWENYLKNKQKIASDAAAATSVASARRPQKIAANHPNTGMHSTKNVPMESHNVAAKAREWRVPGWLTDSSGSARSGRKPRVKLAVLIGFC